MRRRLACERGEISLTQLLAGMAVFAVVLTGVLGSFEGFISVNRDTNDRHETQDRARRALDRLARELRNLASPTQDQPQAVDKATSYDVVVQSVDPNGPNTGLNGANIKRVRYCLDSTDPKNGKLWLQEQKWTTQAAPAVPSTAACPASGWGSQTMVADRIVNRLDGQDRPLFSFNSATIAAISAMHADLYVDLDPARAPAEARLSTGVFLRNQNRAPVAAFTATPSAQGIRLNGSASYDPEGAQLQYVWFDGATKVGTGITFTYVVPAGSSRTITLKVYDPATLEGVAPSQVVIA